MKLFLEERYPDVIGVDTEREGAGDAGKEKNLGNTGTRHGTDIAH
jgi:hypothetical protein